MRLGGLIATLGVAFMALFFLANGSVPVPEPVRALWDKAWERNAEPAKEKWEEMKEKAELPTPAPNQLNLGAPAFSVTCTLPACQ